MILNRNIAPELKVPANITIQKPEVYKLKNGLSLYSINAGEKEVVKFEIIFPTGISNAAGLTDSYACHQLSDAGTRSHSASEIAEFFDFYGAYFHQESGPDFKSFSMYSLTNHFSETLPKIKEIITESTYPKTEVDVYINRHKQMLAINKQKVSWVTRKKFNSAIFGHESIYGFTPIETDYDKISSEELIKHHDHFYSIKNATLIVSGIITKDIINDIDTVFGIDFDNGSEYTNNYNSQANSDPQKIKIDKPGAVQCGIRIGKKLFNKSHPDFLPLQIVNTILGGYFGSRLMSNIREDKGYTYGIGSGLHSYLNSGVFFISTEVGSGVVNQAVDEIFYELRNLAEKPVPEQELNLVKSYLTGAFQRNLDGPFSLADQFKSVHLHDLKYDYFNKYLDYLKIIDAETIMELVSKHLHPDAMTQVIVG